MKDQGASNKDPGFKNPDLSNISIPLDPGQPKTHDFRDDSTAKDQPYKESTLDTIKDSLSHLKDKITDFAESAIKGITHHKSDTPDEEERKKISADVNLNKIQQDIIERRTKEEQAKHKHQKEMELGCGGDLNKDNLKHQKVDLNKMVPGPKL